MKAFTVIAALCVILQICHGQSDCQSQIQAAKQCMEAGESDANKTAAFQACFTSNGCSLPAVNNSDPFTCYRQVIDAIGKPKLQTCVQGFVPSFTLPTDEDDEDGFPHGGFGKGRGGNILNMLNQSCPSQSAVQAVQTCLQGLRSQAKQSGRKRWQRHAGFGRGEGRSRLMEQCFANLTAECKQEMNLTMQAICNCSADLLQNDADLKAAFAACPSDTNVGGSINFIDKAGRMLSRFCNKDCGRHGGRDGGRQPFGGFRGFQPGGQGFRNGGGVRGGRGRNN